MFLEGENVKQNNYKNSIKFITPQCGIYETHIGMD